MVGGRFQDYSSRSKSSLELTRFTVAWFVPRINIELSLMTGSLLTCVTSLSSSNFSF